MAQVSILVPIWGLIAAIQHKKGAAAVGPLRDSVNKARDAVDGARNALAASHNNLNQLQTKRQTLAARDREQGLAAVQLPALAALANAAIQRIDTMEAAVIATEKTTTAAVERASGLSNAAVATADLAISKKDFVAGILDVLEALVMDAPTATGAKPIMDQLSSQYGGEGMPKELQDRCAQISAKLAQFENLET